MDSETVASACPTPCDDIVGVAVSKVLEKNAQASDPLLVERLRGTLERRVKELLPAALRFIGAPIEPSGLGRRNGVFELDARLAEFFEARGFHSAADETRARGRQDSRAERWARPTHLPYALALADFRREHERAESEHRGQPGLISDVARSVARAATPGLWVGGTGRDGPVVLRPNLTKPGYGEPVAVAEVPAVSFSVDEMARGLRLVGSRLAWPFIEWLIETAHQQKQLGISRPDIIVVEGGWRAVAAAVLEEDESAVHPEVRSELHMLARMLGNMPIRWIDGARSSAMFLLHEDAAMAGQGRGRSQVSFKLVERLLDGEVFRTRARYKEAGTRAPTESLRIVPLVRPRVLAPAPGTPRDTFGPQATYLRLLQVYMTENGDQLLNGGLVQVPQLERARLAVEAQMPERLVAPVHEHLAAQNALRVDGEGCAPADAGVRAFIEDGWRRSIERREDALKAKHRKSGVGPAKNRGRKVEE